MRRRQFIILGAAAASLLRCRVGRSWRRKFLGWSVALQHLEGDPSNQAFRRGMNDLGYVDGQNIVFEYRFADGRLERLPELAADLVRLKPI